LQTFVYYGDKPYLAPLSKQWLGFVLGTAVALAGITVAWLLYGAQRLSLRAPEPLTRLLQQRLYLDQLYYRLLADPATRLAQPLAWFDLRVLERGVNGVANSISLLARLLTLWQSGYVRLYALSIMLGAAALVLLLAILGVNA
jgi:NADH-quinone oxidoreductase subunit L